jgi:nitronate monooxygenase
LQTNMLRPSIVAAGLDPENLPERGGLDVAKDLTTDQPRRWRDIWSAGHSVSSVTDVVSVKTLIDSVAAEYDAARGAGAQSMPVRTRRAAPDEPAVLDHPPAKTAL